MVSATGPRLPSSLLPCTFLPAPLISIHPARQLRPARTTSPVLLARRSPTRGSPPMFASPRSRRAAFPGRRSPYAVCCRRISTIHLSACNQNQLWDTLTRTQMKLDLDLDQG
ncbi:hypothetical protein B0H16DRAFT_1886756 [Mycena metata]|uniref:Uncharacterized protein n=1 Tax=Mycena metata TaxID=1033252 RepID=A0AAD7NBS1_9AGAR|nr:hypothetical protein B0H16DRAFT_1886756 [Mycena metata]